MALKAYTHFVFGVAVLGSAAAFLFLLVFPGNVLATIASGVVVAFNLWAVYVSENRGFSRTRQMRRAHEPPRHFSPIQAVLLVLATMFLIGFTLFRLVV